MTLADGKIVDKIDSLVTDGLSLIVDDQNDKATLSVDVTASATDYMNSKLELAIKNTISNEPDWYNTSKIDIYFIKPKCELNQDYFAAFESA